MSKKKSAAKIWIILFLIVFLGLYVYIYVVPQISSIFQESYRAEYGTLEVGNDVEALFVRDERVYTADNSGSVDRIIESGKLMRRNSRIVDVGGTGHYSQDRGIVSYYYDDMESTLTPETMETTTESFLKHFAEKPEGEESDASVFEVKQCVKDSAKAGDKLFKIVDNTKWYLVCWLDKAAGEAYTQGHSVTVAFDDQTRVKMNVESLTEQGSRIQIILSSNRYYDKFDYYRTAHCKLIRTSRSGIIVEADSIVEVDGQKGVNVINKLGNVKFVPVRILSTDGEYTVVEKNYYYDAEGQTVTTIKNYDEILRPQKEKAPEGDAENKAASENE